jgi:oxygen-independent coproporphyrinogen-3 oxidase
VGDAYSQNVKELDEYDRLIKLGKLPVFKGVDLNDDDKCRRAVIMQLICHFELHYADIEQGYAINFHDYFADELQGLIPMQADGLISVNADSIKVLPAGRLLIRNICMVFDRYLAKKQQQFSKVI